MSLLLISQVDLHPQYAASDAAWVGHDGVSVDRVRRASFDPMLGADDDDDVKIRVILCKQLRHHVAVARRASELQTPPRERALMLQCDVASLLISQVDLHPQYAASDCRRDPCCMGRCRVARAPRIAFDPCYERS